MQNRIKTIRKYFEITQKEFGEKIGVKANTITNYELGLRTPSDAVILSICREFRVNESWLRNGEGQMFIEINPTEPLINALSDMIKSNDNVISSIMIAYAQMSEDKKCVLREFADKMVTIYQDLKEKEQ